MAGPDRGRHIVVCPGLDATAALDELRKVEEVLAKSDPHKSFSPRNWALVTGAGVGPTESVVRQIETSECAALIGRDRIEDIAQRHFGKHGAEFGASIVLVFSPEQSQCALTVAKSLLVLSKRATKLNFAVDFLLPLRDEDAVGRTPYETEIFERMACADSLSQALYREKHVHDFFLS
jgi:hypothetical protein